MANSATATRDTGGGINKAEAMRQAVGKLGVNAAPGALREYIKATFGLSMNAKVASTYKANAIKALQSSGRTSTKASPPARMSPTMRPGGSHQHTPGWTPDDLQILKRFVSEQGGVSINRTVAILEAAS